MPDVWLSEDELCNTGCEAGRPSTAILNNG